jgi:phosphoglycerate dehydrogenase-like enzyme
LARSEVARRARGPGMDIIAHDPYAPVGRDRTLGVDPCTVSFDEAISTADFISLHTPLTHLQQSFSMMKILQKWKRVLELSTLQGVE